MGRLRARPRRMRREDASLRALGALGVMALAAVLVPLVLISAYNHSYADDWHYGVWAHLALEETGSVLMAVAAALEQAGAAWFQWQGTYSAIFFMALEPGVFGEQFYVLAAPIVLAVLIAGTFFFTHVAMVELMGAERGAWLAVSCALVAVQLLLQPSPVEGIFWYNSALYYTGYHAAGLALVGVWLRIANPARRVRPRAAELASCVLAFLVAGGNFVTALVVAEVLLVIFTGLIACKRRCAADVLPSFALMVVGLAVSLASPGNEVRQQTQFPDDNGGVWGTIAGSAMAAFQYVQEWSSGLVLLLAALALPLAVRVCERAVERGLRFRAPAAVAAASLALFASSFTPTFWGESSVGPGRVQNCRFDLFCVLVLVNVFWVCGWLATRRHKTGLSATRGAVVSARQAAAGSALALLVMVCVVGAMAVDEDLGEELSSVSAARSLASGQAAAYSQQVWDRIEMIESSDEESLRVPYYTDVPHVLLMGDIKDNMDNYINYRLAQWYGKESIVGYRASLASAVAESAESDAAEGSTAGEDAQDGGSGTQDGSDASSASSTDAASSTGAASSAATAASSASSGAGT